MRFSQLWNNLLKRSYKVNKVLFLGRHKDQVREVSVVEIAYVYPLNLDSLSRNLSKWTGPARCFHGVRLPSGYCRVWMCSLTMESPQGQDSCHTVIARAVSLRQLLPMEATAELSLFHCEVKQKSSSRVFLRCFTQKTRDTLSLALTPSSDHAL